MLYKAFADLRRDARRYYIGYLWWFAEPVIEMAVYYVVFAHLFRRYSDDFATFLLCGVIAWRWFSATLSRGAMGIVNNHALANQVFVPKVIFPVAVVIVNSVKFALALALLMLLLTLYGPGASAWYAMVPMLLMVEFLFISALTVLAAALVPFLPSLQVVIDIGLRVGLFVSGVFFPVASVPPHWRSWLHLNPMVPIIESWRSVLMYQRAPEWGPLIIIAAASVAGLYGGQTIIRRNEFTYPKLTQ
jgi:lipopolysaccharide transport system permease protein